jgi:hypothetical protein
LRELSFPGYIWHLPRIGARERFDVVVATRIGCILWRTYLSTRGNSRNSLHALKLPQFKDFSEHGAASPFAGMFLTIIDPLQHSEIALITAGFNVNESVLAKWRPGEVQPPGRKRHPASRQRSHRDLLAFLISEARAHTHRFFPFSLKNAVREESWSQLHSEAEAHLLIRCLLPTVYSPLHSPMSAEYPGLVTTIIMRVHKSCSVPRYASQHSSQLIRRKKTVRNTFNTVIRPASVLFSYSYTS